MENCRIREDEIDLLLRDVNKHYGYDFLNYSFASIKRRLNRLIECDSLPSFAELRYKVMNDENYFSRFLEELTVNVTEMFRDPSFYASIKQFVFPQLNTYPHIKIWHAGCSTGEEVYSMAIMLKEENLYDKTLIYATDINPAVLETAKSGIFSMQQMKLNTQNYIEAEGRKSFSDYYTAKYEQVIFNESLKENMVFSLHNLVTDQSFNEFNLIICRNVLIYFNNELQNRVLNLFTESLTDFGFLALGSKESLLFSNCADKYKVVSRAERIWKKHA